MLENVKKFGVIVVIAILFSMFSFSLVNLVVEQPDYNDYCGYKDRIAPISIVAKEGRCPSFEEPSAQEREECNSQEGFIEYDYDGSGCPIGYQCSTCSAEYENVSKKFRLIEFITTSIIGLIAIISGMYIKTKSDVIEWVFSGIIIGGIAAIFIGTVSYYNDLNRFVKPFVLLAEMVLIIWVAIRTTRKNKKKDKKK